MTGSSLLLQIVEIELDEGTWDGKVSQEQSYHFAVSGKAFAVIIEYFPQLVKKVHVLFVCYLVHVSFEHV